MNIIIEGQERPSTDKEKPGKRGREEVQKKIFQTLKNFSKFMMPF